MLRLVDLPGYGYAKVPKAVKAAWRPMVEAYLASRETLAGVVVILDIRREPTADDLMLLDWLRSLGVPPLVAITKADKLSKNQQNSRLAKLKPALAPFDPSAHAVQRHHRPGPRGAVGAHLRGGRVVKGPASPATGMLRCRLRSVLIPRSELGYQDILKRPWLA